MALEELKETIATQIRFFLQGESLIIVEMDITRKRETLVLKLFIDRPSGGISVHECADLNRRLCEFLERPPLSLRDFALEVSSPGVDRPLTTQEDFRRCLGRDIRIYLIQSSRGCMQWEGKLLEVRKGSVVLETGGGSLEIPWEQISRAQQTVLL